MSPPLGVKSISSRTVNTVGSLAAFQLDAAVKPWVKERPYNCNGVLEVDCVPGGFVANVA
jgi:hypothetical protein